MINTVTKKYNEDNTFNYEVVYQDGKTFIVPHNEENRHYQEILEWVAEGNTITDNGGGE
jgi:hypothetical protein